MTNLIERLFIIGLLYFVVLATVIKAEKDQTVEVSKDGNFLLVPQLSQAEMASNGVNGRSKQSYITLANGSLVSTQSLACPTYINDTSPHIEIVRTYRTGLIF